MTLTRDGCAVIADSLIAVKDHVRLRLGVQRALYEVALTGDPSPGVTHGLGGGDNSAAVVGGVAEPDIVDHRIGSKWSACGKGSSISVERTQPVVTFPGTGLKKSRLVYRTRE